MRGARGVIGVSLYNVITWNGGDKFPTIENVIDNIAYYANLSVSTTLG